MAGHLRTWNYNKELIIKGLDTLIPGKKDWYVCYWESTTSTDYEIAKFIENSGHNIIKVRSVKHTASPLKNFYIPWCTNLTRASLQVCTLYYLKNIIDFDKRKYEFSNNIKYDITYNIRPDVVYALDNKSTTLLSMILNDKFENFPLQIMGDYVINSNSATVAATIVDDLLQMTGYFSSDILGLTYLNFNRYHGVFQKGTIRGGHCTHAILPHYLFSHGVHSRYLDHLHRDRHIFVSPKLTRPNIDYDKLVFELNNWDGFHYRYHFWNYEYENLWISYSDEKKKEICVQKGIDPRDYYLET